uniref:Transposase domain-containing protein n=1 Tax=Anopheles arabiensis TaxID=7173 RepID=A0A182HYY5_ANOAR
MASMEEEYLNENGDDDDRISDEGSIHNEDTDGEENLEEEYLEGEFLEEASLEIDPESAMLRDSLRTWLIRIKAARSNSLLAILRKASSLSAFSSLPQDVRTLLKAPVNVSQQITKVPGGGEMWYQGVECCFQHYFRGVDVSEDEFELNLSVDGIPIYDRSAIQMWPILMQLHNMPNVPVVVVGIFCGTSKPSDVEPFLRPLVEELNRLHDNKMTLNGKKISVSVRVIIADSPARAFIQQVCYYNGVHGCLKCKCCGTSLKSPKKISRVQKHHQEQIRNFEMKNPVLQATGEVKHLLRI